MDLLENKSVQSLSDSLHGATSSKTQSKVFGVRVKETK